ncbi:hypothetical protein [Neisseria sp. Ec49-e6-T10]|uniref:hypothetical protein n=1 Tax=Neisseria sp. Ec49-e6-T10 TaxID=3140744 RepID=UPI003EBC785D
MNEEKQLPISTQETEEKRFQLNPNPQKHYQMTITVENAPGSFEKLETSISYEAPNCTYQFAGLSAATAHPDKNIPLQFKKIADNKYRGDFYVDAMKDEDYYGQGVCKWDFRRLIALFSATNSEQNTQFSASISPEDLQTKKIEINHLKEDYPETRGVKGDLSSGINKEAFKPEEYFTFIIELEEL